MAENITRCPQCNTSFRISDAHLNSAKGAVRCGSCLNIFNAKENLVSGSNKHDDDTSAALMKSSLADTQRHTAKPATSIAAALAGKQKPEAEAASKSESAQPFTPVTFDEPTTTVEEDRASEKDAADSVPAVATPEKAKAVEKPTPPKTQAKPLPTTPEPATHDDEEDILISDDMDGSNAGKYDNEDLTDDFASSIGSRTGQFEVNLFERAKDEDDEDDDGDSDESWALALLNEDNDPPPPAPTQEELAEEEERRITQEFEASFNFKLVGDEQEQAQQLDIASSESDSVDYSSSDYPEEDDDDIRYGEADDGALSIEDDYDEGYDQSYDLGPEKSYGKSNKSQSFHEDYDVDYDHDYDEDYDESYDSVLKPDADEPHVSATIEQEDDYQHDAPMDLKSSHYLDSIEPEPVEFTFKRHSSFWNSNALWGTLTVVAIITLFVQVSVIKFETLALEEPYRGYYAAVCPIVGCTLPELINRKKIRTANLVVRSHPQVKNALIVDAVLQNTASFEQSFPVLDLVFTNSREKTVAARRLSPEEYLTGDLARLAFMPVRRPVHIAIEISDPGPEAVGYRISIVD